jgi:hypothetical protein
MSDYNTIAHYSKERREKLKQKIGEIMRSYGVDIEPMSLDGCIDEILQEIEKE